MLFGQIGIGLRRMAETFSGDGLEEVGIKFCALGCCGPFN